MARTAHTDVEGAADPGTLEAIALSVRTSYRTVEDMTQGFIREAITRGVFPPGMRLNLDSIAATLGVSRMPVRASLRQLEGEGLVTIHPYRGATVSVLTEEQIAEIYEIRQILELYLLELAMQNLDDSVLERLEVIVNDLESASSLEAMLDQRRTFYDILYERANRPRALALVNQLRAAVGRYLLLQRVAEGPIHGELVDLLRARDTTKAKNWLSSHLQRVSERQQQLVREAEATT